MTDKKEVSKKEKGNATETPVHKVSVNSVSALIYRRQSPSGYTYLDFSLVRSFQSLSSGSTGSSKNFFARNRDDLTRAIELACTWISENEGLRANDTAQAA